MARIPQELKQDFKQENRERTVHAVRILALISLGLYPPTFVMDWISYPEFFWELFTIRFATTFAIALFVLYVEMSRKREWFTRLSRLQIYLFTSIICVSLDWMGFIVGGPDTPYYAGINLLILGLLVTVPWGMVEMSALLFYVVIQFDVFSLLYDYNVEPRLFFISN